MNFSFLGVGSGVSADYTKKKTQTVYVPEKQKVLTQQKVISAPADDDAPEDVDEMSDVSE